MLVQQLFLGTLNPVKVAIVRAAISDWPTITLRTPADLGINLEIEETGQTTLQNAEIKARAYCDRTQLPTLAIDGGLWIERFPPEKQPGTRVRRIRPAAADTDEADVLAYYIRELAAVGGESRCTWEGSLALAWPDQRLVTETYRIASLLTVQARGKAVPGIALAPITVDLETGKYYSEMDWQERPDVARIRRFLSSLSGACSPDSRFEKHLDREPVQETGGD